MAKRRPMVVNAGGRAVVGAGLAALAIGACSQLDGLNLAPADAGLVGGEGGGAAAGGSSGSGGWSDGSGGSGAAGGAEATAGVGGSMGSGGSVGSDGSTHSSGSVGSGGSGAVPDAQGDRADGGLADVSSEGDAPQDTAPSLGWTEVASHQLARQQGVVRVFGTRKACSGVLISHHWVLTTRHCFCMSDLDSPPPVTVYVGGTRFTSVAGTQESWIHAGTVGWVHLHPTLDVALLQLDNAVPFKVTPLLYAGDGSDLAGSVAKAWGFGPTRLDDVGQPTGAGEMLTSAELSIQGNGEASQQGESLPNCGTPLPNQLPSRGPLAVPSHGGLPKVVDGAEGGPLFVGGDDPETRVLVGTLKGTSGARYVFTGLWEIRDWIRDIATDVSPRSACSEPIPNSGGMSKPAVVEGPDLQLHVVAAAQDGTLHHWQRAPDGVYSGPGPIPGARTDLRPGLGKELLAPVGESVKLGLVFRDLQTKELKYLRWPEQTAWSQPITLPGTQNARAVAMAGIAHVVWVAADDVLGGAQYNFDSGLNMMPTAPAPNVDPNRGVSAHYHTGSFGPVIWDGYLTTTNDWNELRGTFKTPEPPFVWEWIPPVSRPTEWQQAVYFGATSGAGAIAAARRVGDSTIVEHFGRLSTPTDAMQLVQLGSNRINVEGDIAAVYVPDDDVWVVSESVEGEPSGLMLRRSTDCFANDW